MDPTWISSYLRMTMPSCIQSFYFTFFVSSCIRKLAASTAMFDLMGIKLPPLGTSQYYSQYRSSLTNPRSRQYFVVINACRTLVSAMRRSFVHSRLQLEWWQVLEVVIWKHDGGILDIIREVLEGCRWLCISDWRESFIFIVSSLHFLRISLIVVTNNTYYNSDWNLPVSRSS